MSNHDLNQTGPGATAKSVVCWRLSNGQFARAEASVVIEKELSIFINGEHLVTASIAPGMEREFVTGYLFGQGFIENIEEVASVNVAGSAARVTLKDARKMSQIAKITDYRIVSGGGKVVFFNEASLPGIQSRMKVGKKEIFRAMNAVLGKAGVYRETEGTHAAGLFTPEATPICLVEDIGRHNTLDKVIGYGLLNSVDFGNTFLASTGRMSSEMVAKICRARIPIVATKTAVTQSGLEIGRRCGLTIIGFARDTGTRINTDMEVRVITEPGMKIYTNAARILAEESALAEPQTG